MTPGKFAMLRRKLQKDRDLGAIMTYFFDHFADHREFIKMSEPGRSEAVELILPVVVQSLVGLKRVAMKNVAQMRVPDQQMWHGSFMVDNAIGSFFYFEDLDMGLVGLTGGWLDGQLVTARFRAKALPLKNESP
ncbi:MAG: hypothetical protein ACK4UU_05205 [Fimbriimonadales bacterium]